MDDREPGHIALFRWPSEHLLVSYVTDFAPSDFNVRFWRLD